jgi:heterodisulfide reductase subunit A
MSNSINGKIGAVLVVGGGIGGIQSALDLADSGFKVYLLEKGPSIGGVMAQLDKTFPTNDCAMCILAPKLVSVARHPNVELITYADLEEISGNAGDFRVKIRQKPRYIDADKCVGCGVCTEKCPVKIEDSYNEGLSERKAIGIDYPQAVPATYFINDKFCLYFTKSRCRVCEKICPAKAVDFEQKEKIIDIGVGAIIIASGLDRFDARLKSVYGYDRYANVIKSVELERILNASGPFQGHLRRLSDLKEPRKIAFIQCVGSRDAQLGNTYCSSVCCVYAIKEAILIKEHSRDVECTIFYIDIRTFGKGFEAYYKRAKEQYGVRFERALIAEISEISENRNLLVRYENESGVLVKKDFDLVVLSVGLVPKYDIKKLAEVCSIELNDSNFVSTIPFSLVETARPGIFVCGTVSSPKDIPETVTEASAAAGITVELLKEARNSLVKRHEFPKETDVCGQEPRIGAFICHCGINIAGTIAVKEVVEYTKTLPNVVFAEDNLYSCSDDAQRHIKDMIEEHNLNRIVVGACTPRTHEPLFQETIREKGLNKYLLEFVNIRDQCSWVHSHEPKEATEKAKDLVRMACARSLLLESLSSISIPMTQKGLIIGGGISGLNAALALANQNYEVFLVEREQEFGGNARNIFLTIDGREVNHYLTRLITQVESHPKIHVYKNSKVEEISGYIGNFKTKVRSHECLEDIEHGIVIVATGAQEYKPTEYLYGQDKRIITQSELEERLLGSQTNGLSDNQTVVMIQCIGSRDDSHPYCSRVCCSRAVKNALLIKRNSLDTEVIILYKDMRTYAFNEIHYRAARSLGVVFIRYDDDFKPELRKDDGNLCMKIKDPILNEHIELPVDLVVLSTGIISDATNKETAQLLKVPLNEDGFFLEAHMKLRPVDFATDGVFLCGLAHSPKTIDESIAQAIAAADRAGIILAKETIDVSPAVAFVDEDRCVGCGICERMCPYQAHVLKKTEKGMRSEVITASCKGCGSCASSCPQQAIIMKHFTDEQIFAQIEALAG